MAALQTLRTKAPVVITIVISLALLAFILTDLLGSGSSIFGNSTTVGVIDGNTINIQDFENEIRASEQFAEMNAGRSLTDEEQSQTRENVWKKKIQDITFGALYEKAGIAVTGEEILDMVIGNHISPYLRQVFTNPQTGVYDRDAAENFLRTKNDNGRQQAAFFWSNIESSLKSERLTGKYLGLLRQSIYCNKAQIEVEKAKRGQNFNVNFVNIRYAQLPDSTVEVSNAEIKKLYDKNIEMYRTDETRDIEYVSFPVRPTDEDREELRKELESLKVDFADPQTDAAYYAQMNAETPAVARFMSKEQLSPILASFVETAAVGEVYGPYLEGNAYKISRLSEVAMRPDSVKARHILIPDNQQFADSLLGVIKKGGKFADLAREYSKDNGSAINGGDLGWFVDGTMVPEFNEACFTNPKGSVVVVKSQFGYHVIEVQERGANSKKYKLATIDKSIRSSSRTMQQVYSEALVMASNVHDAASFNAYVDTANIIKRVARSIRSNARSVNAVRRARDLVKWAFNAEVGEVSSVMSCEDEFVIAVLTKEQEKGYTAISEVSSSLSQKVRNNKKAGDVTVAAQGKSLAEVAELYKAKVDSASNISFGLNSVPGAGIEPALVGKIASLESGKTYCAVEGNNGVYVVEVTAATPVEISDEQVKNSYSQMMQNQQYALYQYVTDVEIEDNRIRFY